MKARDLKRPLAAYVALLWGAMGATGKGYKRDSLRHTGKGDDRRKDKLVEGVESKLQRKARLGEIGVRS